MERAYVVVVPDGWAGSGDEMQIVGPISPTADPATVLETPAGARVYLVGLEEALLSSAHPRLSDSGSWSLGPISTELLADRSCDLEGWVHQSDEIELSFFSERPGIQIFELSSPDRVFLPSPEPPFAEALSLRSELDACFGGRRLILEPFAESPYPDSEDLTSYAQVQYLDDDTLLVVGAHIRVVRRGVRDEAERWLPLAGLGLETPPAGFYWSFTAAAIHGSAESGTGVVGVSLVSTAGRPTAGGVLMQLVLTPSSLVAGAELFRTNIPTREYTARFGAITFDEAGRWVAVGEGLVVSATTTTGRPQVIESSSSFDPYTVRATGLDSRPFVIAGKNILRWGSPFAGDAELEDFPIPDDEVTSRRNIAVDVSVDGDEVIVDVLRSTVEISRGRSGNSRWQEGPVWVNEAPVLCRHDLRCGRPRAALTGNLLVTAAKTIGEAHFVAPESCSAVYLVDEHGACAISADIGAFDSRPMGNTDQGELSRGIRHGERAVFTGQRGRILEARLEP